MINILRRIWSHLLVFSKARRNRTDLIKPLLRRPQLAVAMGFYESALLTMGRIEPELKVLAVAKTAMMVNCEFCLDIGSAIARHEGVSEDKLRELATFEESSLFSAEEKLVIGYARAISSTPAEVSDQMRADLEARFSLAQLAELTAEITWENQRARFNQGLGIRPAGFSDGAFCMVPEAR